MNQLDVVYFITSIHQGQQLTKGVTLPGNALSRRVKDNIFPYNNKKKHMFLLLSRIKTPNSPNFILFLNISTSGVLMMVI